MGRSGAGRPGVRGRPTTQRRGGEEAGRGADGAARAPRGSARGLRPPRAPGAGDDTWPPLALAARLLRTTPPRVELKAERTEGASMAESNDDLATCHWSTSTLAPPSANEALPSQHQILPLEHSQRMGAKGAAPIPQPRRKGATQAAARVSGLATSGVEGKRSRRPETADQAASHCDRALNFFLGSGVRYWLPLVLYPYGVWCMWDTLHDDRYVSPQLRQLASTLVLAQGGLSAWTRWAGRIQTRDYWRWKLRQPVEGVDQESLTARFKRANRVQLGDLVLGFFTGLVPISCVFPHLASAGRWTFQLGILFAKRTTMAMQYSQLDEEAIRRLCTAAAGDRSLPTGDLKAPGVKASACGPHSRPVSPGVVSTLSTEREWQNEKRCFAQMDPRANPTFNESGRSAPPTIVLPPSSEAKATIRSAGEWRETQVAVFGYVFDVVWIAASALVIIPGYAGLLARVAEDGDWTEHRSAKCQAVLGVYTTIRAGDRLGRRMAIALGIRKQDASPAASIAGCDARGSDAEGTAVEVWMGGT